MHEKSVVPLASNPAKTRRLLAYLNAITDEFGITTLVGEYNVVGTNHGKMYFIRTNVHDDADGADDMTVFLYWRYDRGGNDLFG